MRKVWCLLLCLFPIIVQAGFLSGGGGSSTGGFPEGCATGEAAIYNDSSLTWECGSAASVTDPNSDTAICWDDVDGAVVACTVGAGLTYTHATHTLSSSAAGDAAADGATKGVATFVANDMDCTSGVCGIDYTNGQAAATGVKGFLTGTDWDTFNGKQDAITRPVTGPASATAGNLAIFGASGQIIADGGTPFTPASPGAIGETSANTGKFTRVKVDADTSYIDVDGSNNLTFTDAVTGTKTLAELVPSTSNFSLGANELLGSVTGSALYAFTLDTDLSSVSGSDDSVPSAKATKAMGDLKLTISAPAVIDGSAHVHLTAAQMSDPRCQVSNYGQTTADVNIGFPTAEAGLSCLFTVATAQSNHWGVLAAANDKIYLIAAAGTVAAGDEPAAAVMVAAQLGQSFACWSFNSGNDTYDWMCKAVSIGTSTFEAHAAF